MYRVNAGSGKLMFGLEAKSCAYIMHYLLPFQVKVRLSLLAGDRAEFSSSFDCGATIWDIMSSFDELKRYYNSSGPVLHPLVHIDRYSSYANLMENDPNQKFTCLIMGKVV